jgi:mono/diheme cytochrome c family protein
VTKFLSVLIAVLCILLVSLPAQAGCGYRRAAVVVETPVIVTPAIVTAFTPLVAVPVAAYSAAYVGPVGYAPPPVTAAPAAAQQTPCDQALAELRGRLAALESRQSNDRQGGPEAIQRPAAAPDAPPGQVLFQNRCAACHDAAKLKPSQPAFRRDGKLILPDCPTAGDSMAAVSLEEMPPKSAQPLTADEARDLILWLREAAKGKLVLK